MLFHFGWQMVEAAVVMFGGKLRTSFLEQLLNLIVKLLGVDSLLGDVILMHDVAEEVTVIRLCHELAFNLLWQHFKPVPVIPPQRNIDGDKAGNVTAFQSAKRVAALAAPKRLRLALFASSGLHMKKSPPCSGLAKKSLSICSLCSFCPALTVSSR